MSRSILPSLSSSRQMMIAWNVSGLSHGPAIIASRPASMRLAIAISPSRDKSSTEPISRRYMRTGSSVRSAGSARVSERVGIVCGASALLLVAAGVFDRSAGLHLLRLHDVDAHVGQHRHRISICSEETSSAGSTELSSS